MTRFLRGAVVLVITSLLAASVPAVSQAAHALEGNPDDGASGDTCSGGSVSGAYTYEGTAPPLYVRVHVPHNATVTLQLHGFAAGHRTPIANDGGVFEMGVIYHDGNGDRQGNRGPGYGFAKAILSSNSDGSYGTNQATTPANLTNDWDDQDALVYGHVYLAGSPLLQTFDWYVAITVTMPDNSEYTGCDAWLTGEEMEAELGDQNSASDVGDPVNPSTGNYFDSHVDLPAPADAYRMGWTRTYNSMDFDTTADPGYGQVGVLGPGWSTPLDVSLRLLGNGDLKFRGADGRRLNFPSVPESDPPAWAGPDQLYATVTEVAGAEIRTLRFAGGEEWAFDLDGHLLSMSATDGQTVEIGRDATTGMPESMQGSTLGGDSYQLTFADGNHDGLIDSATGPGDATVDYAYTDGFLTSVSRPHVTGDTAPWETFEYGGVRDQLTDTYSIVDPAASPVHLVHNEYGEQIHGEDFGRILSQDLPSGDHVDFVYEPYDDTTHTARTTVTHTAGTDVQEVQYFRNAVGQLVGIEDPYEATASWTWERDQLTAATDRVGANTTATYDDAGRLTALGLADPESGPPSDSIDVAWCDTDHGALTDDDPRLLSYTDPTGVETSYRYGDTEDDCEPGERVLSEVTVAGATTTVTSAGGLVTSTTDADGVTTSYGWDTVHRLLLSESVDNDTGAVGVQTTYYGYDDAGRLKVSRSPLGIEHWYDYEPDGQLAHAAEPLHFDRECTITCDFGSFDDLGEVQTNRYVYWADGSLLAAADLTNAETTYKRDYLDGDGWTDTTTGPEPYDGSGADVTVAVYDAAGKLTEQRVGDPDNNAGDRLVVTHFDYDDLGRLNTETSPEGVETHYHYDNDGRVTGTTIGTDPDDAGHTSTIEYDRRGRVTDDVGPEGDTDPADDPVQTHTHYIYDAADRVTSITEGNGDDARTTWLRYDTQGRLQYRIVDLDNDSVPNDPSSTDPGDQDPEDQVTEYTYKPSGRLESEITPPQDATSYVWGTSSAEVQTVTVTATGGTYTLRLDGETTDPIAYDATHDTVETRLEDLTGVADGDVTVTGSAGGPYTLTWSAARGDVNEPFPDTALLTGPAHTIAVAATTEGFAPLVTSYDYNDAGRLKQITPPHGPVETITYDDDDRVHRDTRPGGDYSEYGYDLAGNVTSETTPSPTGDDTAVATCSYSLRGEVTASTDPHDPDDTTYPGATFAYDPRGLLYASTDARYDATTFPQARATYTYDGRGNRLTRTARAKNSSGGSYHDVTEHWSYNDDDQLVEYRRPTQGVGEGTNYGYDDTTGQLATITQPSTRLQEITYWNSGQVKTRTWSADDMTTITQDEWYDSLGRRTRLEDDHGDTDYVWDRHNLISEFTVPGVGDDDPYVYDYTYDLGGRQTALDARSDDTSHEHKFRYRHNWQGDLTSALVYVPSFDFWWPLASYGYNDNGDARTEVVNGVFGSRTWAYPENGSRELSGYTQTLSTGGDVTTDFTRRDDGRLASETFNDYLAEYTYDDAGQLLSQHTTGPSSYNTTRTYTYDARGNRLSQANAGVTTAYTYTDNSELVSAIPSSGESNTYTYDQDGRRTDRYADASSQHINFDARGLPSDIHNVVGETGSTDYRAYDGDGHMVNTVINETQSLDMIWDPTQPIPRNAETYLNSDLWVRQAWANENVGYELVTDTSTLGFGLYGYDAHGDVIPNSSTDTSAPYGYDPYGTPTNQPSTPVFAGYRGEMHADNLIHLRARDYDPTTGAFLTTDPLDGIDGTPTVANPYAYANNDPINRQDPLGLRAGDSDLTPCVAVALAAAADPVPAADDIPIDLACVALVLTATVIAGAIDYTIDDGLGTNLSTDDDPSQDPVDPPVTPRPRSDPDCDAPQTEPPGRFYHGTDVSSARGFLAGSPLDDTAAAAGKIDGAPGFYLATDEDDAWYFAARRGQHTVLAYDIAACAVAELVAAGSELRPIPQGRAPFPFRGSEFFVPTSAFSIFNDLRTQGDIIVSPA